MIRVGITNIREIGTYTIWRIRNSLKLIFYITIKRIIRMEIITVIIIYYCINILYILIEHALIILGIHVNQYGLPNGNINFTTLTSDNFEPVGTSPMVAVFFLWVPMTEPDTQ